MIMVERRRTSIRFGVVAALTLLLAACGPAVDTPEACALVRKAELPVTFVGNRPVVKITLNGHKANVVLDTGSDVSLFNKTSAALLNLTVNWNKPDYAVGAAGVIQQYPAAVRSAEIGPGLPLSGGFAVAGLPMKGHEDIDGLIGRGALQDFDVDLDFPNDRLVFYRARHCPSAKPNIMSDLEELPGPIAWKAATRPGMLITATLDGAPQTTLVDTGASFSVVNLDRLKEIGVTGAILYKEPTGTVGDAVGTKLGFVVHKFKTLKVGRTEVDAPLLAVIRLPDFPKLPAFDMILGNDYLRFHRVWLSFASGKAYGAVPPSSEASAAPPDARSPIRLQ